MDLSKLSDVELTEHWLALAKKVPSPRKALKAAGDEAAMRGPARMEAARIALGGAREAARQVTP